MGHSVILLTMASTASKGAAIISGAAQGIGRAIALRLAQDGYDIAVNDIPLSSAALETLTEEIRSKGRKAIVVTGDISQEQVVQLLVDKTVEELGELRVVRMPRPINGYETDCNNRWSQTRVLLSLWVR